MGFSSISFGSKAPKYLPADGQPMAEDKAGGSKNGQSREEEQVLKK
jgi:hypothetical protein